MKRGKYKQEIGNRKMGKKMEIGKLKQENENRKIEIGK